VLAKKANRCQDDALEVPDAQSLAFGLVALYRAEVRLTVVADIFVGGEAAAERGEDFPQGPVVDAFVVGTFLQERFRLLLARQCVEAGEVDSD